MKRYAIVPHTADLKLRIYGNTMQELFENALIGMFESMQPKSELCTYANSTITCSLLPKEHGIFLTNTSYDLLLVDFLSEALVYSDIYNEAYFAVTWRQLTPTTIDCTVHGVSIDGFKESEIKAVTYHDLHIAQIDGQWQTDLVFDV